MKFKRIVLFIITLISVFIINTKGVYALGIKVENIEVIDKGDNITISDNDVKSDIEFNELNDYVAYKITIKNSDNVSYDIDTISDNNKNDNINVTYKYDGKIEPKSTKDIYVTLKYDKKLVNKKSVSINNITITVNLVDENGNKNNIKIVPNTGDNIIKYIIIFVIVLLVLIFSLLLIKRRKGKKELLILLVLIPSIVLANEKLKIDIKFTNITINNGEILSYKVSIDDGNGNITDRMIKYGEQVGELPIPSKEEYTFSKYIDQNNNEVTSATKVLDNMTITPIFVNNKYTISFNSNGGNEVEPMIIESTNSINNLPVTAKDDYRFAGWYTGLTDGIKVTDKYIPKSDITLYAHWYPMYAVAQVNDKFYTTLQSAIDSASNNTETIVKVLIDINEEVIINKNKNILLDIQNNTISNISSETTNAVITNNGTLKIINGTITSSGKAAVINNNSKSNLVIDGINISATGSRQAIYNNGGTVEITGDSYLTATTTERATIQNLSSSTLKITSGKIISNNHQAVNNSGIMTIGTKDNTINNTPILQGKTYGVMSNSNFNYYDGIIKGQVKSINNEERIIDIEDSSYIENETSILDGIKYNVSYLKELHQYNIIFNPNGGEVDEKNRLVIYDKKLDLLPIPKREGYYFAGWYSNITDEIRIDSNYIPDCDMTLYAKWDTDNTFETTYNQLDSCTFNGSNTNITGSNCDEYITTNYINTGVYLFSKENAKKDFELYFELDSYDSNDQENGSNKTLVSSKNENKGETIVHGFAVRKSENNIQLVLSTDGIENITISKKSEEVHSLKIKRIDGNIYYSFNNEEMIFLADMNDFTDYFDVPVTFGAALNYKNEPFRFIKATISNMYIKLGINDEY